MMKPLDTFVVAMLVVFGLLMIFLTLGALQAARKHNAPRDIPMAVAFTACSLLQFVAAYLLATT